MQHSVAYDNHTFDSRQFTFNIRRCTQRSVPDDNYTFYTRQFTFLQQIIHSQQQTMQFSIAADNPRSKPYIIYLIIDGRLSLAYQYIHCIFKINSNSQPNSFYRRHSGRNYAVARHYIHQYFPAKAEKSIFIRNYNNKYLFTKTNLQ